jgi:Protein of unknown function (DUF1559)
MTTSSAHPVRLRWFVGTAVSLVLLTFLLGANIEHLLLGWIYFPLRVLPQFRIDWPTAAIGLVAFAAFVFGLHFTLGWFLRRLTFDDKQLRGWPFRSTIATALLVLLLFLGGTAMVGVTHQGVWLLVGRSTDNLQRLESPIGVVTVARQSALQMQAGNNLKITSLSIQNYHDVFQAIPPGGTMTEDGELLHGWGIFGLLGMINPDGIDFSLPWNQPPNARFYKCNFRYFVNPGLSAPQFDSQGFGLSHFAGNLHVLGTKTIVPRKHEPLESFDDSIRQIWQSGQALDYKGISDGATNTILIGTVAENLKPWGHPANVRNPGRGINRHPDGFGGPPQWNGAMFSFCDGHTQFVSSKADPRVLQQLATPAGGEQATADDLPGR